MATKQLGRVARSLLFPVLSLCVTASTTVAQKLALGNAPRLYVGMDDYGTTAGNFFRQNNISTQVRIIYEGSIDPQRVHQVNADSLRAAITRAFPDPQQGGIGVLDIESAPYSTMRKADRGSADFNSAVNDYFIKAIRIAKATRPNVYWGFYGLPYNNFARNSAGSWDATCQKLSPLFQEADILFPSLYERNSRFLTGADLNSDNADNVQGFMQHILSFAVRINKPVMPFIWHRWHPSSARDANHVIPQDEFSRYLQSITKAGKGNPLFKGIVWWGADVYLYRYHKDQLGDDERQQNNFSDYHDSLLMQYGKSALKALQ
ncbi:hypothetical protein DCC81_18715 [Chitinophaga parva]|uniref:GH26 domain-containing protein n=1 Tax=Chitinophaga parva TaxID=2169414 RepID=A0A2T7BJ08_9BACT|nr:hypothetical protein DCC81_18715 [Chitinophaga parva]